MMGSYQQLPKPEQPPEQKEIIEPLDNDLFAAMGQAIKLIYNNDEIVLCKIIQSEKFCASYSNMVFDFIVTPNAIQANKIATALINNYNIELIYFIPERIPIKHNRVSFRYVGDYIKILQHQNRSDIVRWINQFRNRFEETYERTKRAKSLQAHAAYVSRERDLRKKSI